MRNGCGSRYPCNVQNLTGGPSAKLQIRTSTPEPSDEIHISVVALLLALSVHLGSSTIARRDSLYRFNYENVLGTSLETDVHRNIGSAGAQS